MDIPYGLQLTENSKAGWAFSLPRRHTCISSTAICRRLCYGNGIRYRHPTQIQKRLQNYKSCELLLECGGPALLAQNLVILLDQARPADWLTSQVTGTPTVTPWAVRLFDIGDAYSVPFVQALVLASGQRPECSLWFYTRSFYDKALLAALCELASQPNCQGWLSIDSENYIAGLRAYDRNPAIWKLALLQEPASDLPARLIPEIQKHACTGKVVNFPYHHGGHHVDPVLAEPLITCPQITGAYPLERARCKPKPCQACAFCLPAHAAQS